MAVTLLQVRFSEALYLAPTILHGPSVHVTVPSVAHFVSPDCIIACCNALRVRNLAPSKALLRRSPAVSFEVIKPLRLWQDIHPPPLRLPHARFGTTWILEVFPQRSRPRSFPLRSSTSISTLPWAPSSSEHSRTPCTPFYKCSECSILTQVKDFMGSYACNATFSSTYSART